MDIPKGSVARNKHNNDAAIFKKEFKYSRDRMLYRFCWTTNSKPTTFAHFLLSAGYLYFPEDWFSGGRLAWVAKAPDSVLLLDLYESLQTNYRKQHEFL